MKKSLLNSMLVAGMLAIGTSAWAQTDVTSEYLKNADFSGSTATDAEAIFGYGKDGQPYSLQDVDGWTKVVVQGDDSNADYPGSGMGAAVMAYGSSTILKGNNVSAPAAGPDGGTGNSLGFFAVWGCGGYYAQDVTLKPGEYTLTVPIYCQSGANATTSYTGFFPTEGTSYTVLTSTPVGEWSTQTVKFTVINETAGQIRLGYKSNGSGSPANPMIFIDGIKIEFAEADLLPFAKEDLQKEIEFATQLMDNVGEDSPSLAGTISFAEAMMQNATSVEQVNQLIDKLKEAEEAYRNEFMFPYQKYLLANIGTEKYWGVGNDWGTRASLVPHPEYLKLVPQPDGKYHLESQVNNGGTSYYFNGEYMDNDRPIQLLVKKFGNEPLGENEFDGSPVWAYTISNNDGNYYGYDGESTVMGKNVDPENEDGNGLWIIASLNDAKNALSLATKDEPADATFLVEDHDFGRNNRYSNRWTYTSETSDGKTNFNISGGNNTNNCAESYHAKFSISQTLADAPAGDYELFAQGFYRVDEVEGQPTADLPVFFANDVTATFPEKTGEENNMNDASVSFSAGDYTIEPIKFTVTEAGNLTIGARLEQSTNLWCIFDNFVLYYYGPGVDTGISAMKAEQPKDNTIYNLQGQRVQNAQKGLYIKNGKKVVLK